MLRKLILFLSCGMFIGCGALNTARPLAQGENAVGVTFGGLLVTQLGPPIPVPNLVLERKTGIAPIGGRPTDVNYGINTTALAFGTVGVHAGITTLLAEQKGWMPSVSVLERLHVYSNYTDFTNPMESRGIFALNQIDLTMAWDVKRHLGYVGVANYVDLIDPELNIAPFAGFAYHTKKRFFWQLESRYLAANRTQDVDDISVYSFGENGGLSVTASFGWKLGGSQ